MLCLQEAGEEGDGQAQTDTAEQAPAPPPEAPSTATVLARMVVSFFTSLVPAQPPAMNGN